MHTYRHTHTHTHTHTHSLTHSLTDRRLQLSLERLVLRDDALHDAAKAALQATVRAYSTYPASMKGFFHVKSLHLGHLAKSFALREAPGEVAGQQSKKHKKDNADGGEKRDSGKKRKTFKESLSEEFGAGDSNMAKRKRR
jgi:ATP-dependent RNA helicase DDX31/DBP7